MTEPQWPSTCIRLLRKSATAASDEGLEAFGEMQITERLHEYFRTKTELHIWAGEWIDYFWKCILSGLNAHTPTDDFMPPHAQIWRYADVCGIQLHLEMKE